jgi:hypothetical protein
MDRLEDCAVINGRSLIDIPVHPAADLFPMIADSDDQAMVSLINSIKANGQLHPIIMWNGVIVDGRNRYAACKQAGIAPKTKSMQFESDADAIRYIISTNIHRRHLDPRRIPAIAADLATMMRGRPSEDNPQKCGNTTAEVAERLGTSERQVELAKEVKAKAPDLFQKMKTGEMRTGTAHRLMKERARQTQPATDPDRADDAVVDAKIERASNGYTPKMEKVWAAYSALDAVEQTAFRERMNA